MRSPATARPSLLESLQGLIERTYRMVTGVREIGRFVIGDEGYRRLYTAGGGAASRAPGPPPPAAAGAAGGGARVLVRDGPTGVAARIYYPDILIQTLETHPPTRGLGEPNVDPFAVFVEELDHFLLIAERTRRGRPVSLLELEMHANVTKYLVCALFLSRSSKAPRGGRAAAEDRLWLRWHLFEKAEFNEPDPEVQTRYRDAARYAHRFLDRLDAEPTAPARLARLRAFHDSSPQQKLQLFG